MKSIYQMELEDKFNRKIKYREKKIETQRKVIGKQREQIFQLRKQLQQKENIIKEVREEIIKDRKKSYGNLAKKAFYCNKTGKLLEILDKENKQ